MTEEMFSEFRELNRQHFKSIREIVKNGDLDVLTEDGRRIAEIMQEHQDGYFKQFEMADLTHDYEFDPDSDETPFIEETVQS